MVSLRTNLRFSRIQSLSLSPGSSIQLARLRVSMEPSIVWDKQKVLDSPATCSPRIRWVQASGWERKTKDICTHYQNVCEVYSQRKQGPHCAPCGRTNMQQFKDFSSDTWSQSLVCLVDHSISALCYKLLASIQQWHISVLDSQQQMCSHTTTLHITIPTKVKPDDHNLPVTKNPCGVIESVRIHTCQAPPGGPFPSTRWGMARSGSYLHSKGDVWSDPKSLSGSSRESKSTAMGLEDRPSNPSHRYSKSWREKTTHAWVLQLWKQPTVHACVFILPALAATGGAARPACCAAGGWGATPQVTGRGCNLTTGTTGRSQTGRYLRKTDGEPFTEDPYTLGWVLLYVFGYYGYTCSHEWVVHLQKFLNKKVKFKPFVQLLSDRIER